MQSLQRQSAITDPITLTTQSLSRSPSVRSSLSPNILVHCRAPDQRYAVVQSGDSQEMSCTEHCGIPFTSVPTTDNQQSILERSIQSLKYTKAQPRYARKSEECCCYRSKRAFLPMDQSRGSQHAALVAHPLSAQVCQEALRWLGTPFVHQACLKGVGVDCANLVLGISQTLGLVDPAYRAPVYHPAWHVHMPGEWLWTTMLSLGATALAVADATAGDVVLVKWPGCRSHGHCAVLMPHGQMLHAMVHHGVTMQDYTPGWRRRVGLAVRLPRPQGVPWGS